MKREFEFEEIRSKLQNNTTDLSLGSNENEAVRDKNTLHSIDCTVV